MRLTRLMSLPLLNRVGMLAACGMKGLPIARAVTRENLFLGWGALTGPDFLALLL